MADPEKIEGLPAGAVVRPIQGDVEGLPPGAVVRPLGGSDYRPPGFEQLKAETEAYPQQGGPAESNLSRFGKAAYGMTPLPLAAPPSTAAEKVASVAGPGGLVAERLGAGAASLLGQIPEAAKYWAGAVQNPHRTIEELKTIKPELEGMAAGGVATAVLPKIPAASATMARGAGAALETAGRFANTPIAESTRAPYVGLVTPARVAGGLGGGMLARGVAGHEWLPEAGGVIAGAELGQKVAQGVEAAGRGLRRLGGYEPPYSIKSLPKSELIPPPRLRFTETPEPELTPPPRLRFPEPPPAPKLTLPPGIRFPKPPEPGLTSPPPLRFPEQPPAPKLTPPPGIRFPEEAVAPPRPMARPPMGRTIPVVGGTEGSTPPKLVPPPKLGRTIEVRGEQEESGQIVLPERPGIQGRRVILPGERVDPLRVESAGSAAQATTERLQELAAKGDQSAKNELVRRRIPMKGMPTTYGNVPLPR